MGAVATVLESCDLRIFPKQSVFKEKNPSDLKGPSFKKTITLVFMPLNGEMKSY